MKTPIKILRLSQVEDATGLSRTQIGELAKRNLFPAPVRLTARTNGYVESEVQCWIEGRITLRNLDNPELLRADAVLNADLTRGAA